MPWMPRLLQNRAARRPAEMLRSMLPFVGIVPEQYSTMNNWTKNMLDCLEAHFTEYPFLLGARPTLGDFSLVGTMYGHLGRDPWPRRELIEPRKQLNAWLERMKNPAFHATYKLVPHDEIPVTLAPVFQSIFQEFIPMVANIAELATAYAKQNGLNRRLPRRIGEVSTTMGGEPFKRGALPYTIWMVQRALDCYQQMSDNEKHAVREWLKLHKAECILNLNLPRVERRALTVAVTALPHARMEKAA
jgi:hypothetical protein